MNTLLEEKDKILISYAWGILQDNLPKSIERSALGDEKIYTAFYPAVKTLIDSIRQSERERIIEIAEGMKKAHPDLIGEVCQSCQEICRGNCDCDVPIEAYNQALSDLISKLKE